jgi:hypothetical protein
MGAEGRVFLAFQWGYRFHPSRNVSPSAAGFWLPGLPFQAGAGSSGWQRPTGKKTRASMALAYSIAWDSGRKTNLTQKYQVAVSCGGLASMSDLGDNSPIAEG